MPVVNITKTNLDLVPVDIGDVREFIEIFADFQFDKIDVFTNESAKKPGLRGSHEAITGLRHHTINLYISGLNDAVQKKISCGGNFTVPADLREAFFMTLLHELRHAWQFSNKQFNLAIGKSVSKGKYFKRPHEVDARKHVDRKHEEILSFLGKPHRVRKPEFTLDVHEELQTIADLFSELEDVSQITR